MKNYWKQLFVGGGTSFLLFLSIISLGQDNISSNFKYVKEYNLNANFGDAVIRGKVAMSWPLLVWFSKGDKKIFIYNVETKITDGIKVKGVWHEVFISGNYLIDVADKGANNKISVYSAVNNIWNMDSSWVSSYDISMAFANKNQLKLGSFYINETPFLEVNRKSFKLMDFSYPIMLHTTPKVYINFSENLNIICDPGKYEVTIFNNELEEIGAFSYLNSDFEGINDSLYKSIKENYKKRSPGNSFGALRKLEGTSDNVWTTELINDTAILVKRTDNSGTEPTRLKMVYDIWIKDGDWKLNSSGLSNKYPEQEEVIGEDCSSFQLGEYGSKYFVEDGKLYVVKIEIPKNVQGMTYGDFKTRNNDWFFEHELNYKMYVYKIVI